MKRATKYKNLICFAVVLIVLISITAIPAYADFPPLTTAGRRMGAFLLSAIQAINITLTSTAAQSTGAEICNYLSDPLDVQYSYQEMWTDQPKIQIWEDYISIDGVEYTDVWLSNEAATKFQVNAYDFKSAYNIASNQNGTFVSGDGYLEDTLFFDVNGEIRSQNISTPFSAGTYDTGSILIHQEPIQTSPDYLRMYGTYNGQTGSGDLKSSSYFPVNWKVTTNSLGTKANLFNQQKGQTGWSAVGQFNCNYTRSPFDLDYVSGTIPAQRVLDEDEGLMLRIPSNSIPQITQFVTDNPEFAEPGGAPIDVNIDPDIMTKLDDLIDIIAPIIPILQTGDVQFTVNHTEPQPEPGLPDTVFPVTQVDNALQPVINTINNNTQNIIENIPAPSEISQPIIQEIQNTGDEIIENIPKIDEICNNIDTAPYHDLDTGLDRLPSFFLPFITDLRSALGIWHYVTEWLAQISTTFAFVSSCLVGTSIMTPIYAAIAGFMCIKIYRRMTA